MASTAPAPRQTGDPSFGGLVQIGETLVGAVKRLEAGPDYARIIASEAGQRLLEAINIQARDARNGKGHAPAKTLTAEEAPAQAAAAAVDRGPFLEDVPLELIDIGENVRVDPGELAELAASIAELGVLQPIRVIGPSHDGRYRAVWGQRRVMASVIANKVTIPALIEPSAEANAPGARRSIEQLAENLQRKDLNAIEEAVAMRAVLDADPSLTQEQLATRLGRSGAWVSNTLRLLETAPEVQDLVRTEKLTTAHAKAIAGLDVDLQADFAERVVGSKWSSADTERNAKFAKEDAKRTRAERAAGEKHAAATIAILEKVANRDKATVYVDTYGPGATVKKLLEADGWKAVASSYSIDAIASAGSCGCDGVWKVNVPYSSGSVTVSPACNNEDHKKARIAERNAGWKRENEKRERERKAAAAEREVRKGQLATILEAAPLDPFSLRLAIYALVTDEGSEEIARVLGIGEDEADESAPDLGDVLWTGLAALPDDALGGIFARAIAQALDDDWRLGDGIKAAIAAALPKPPEVPAAKPAKGRKAAGS